jgi:hypothetical protein
LSGRVDHQAIRKLAHQQAANSRAGTNSINSNTQITRPPPNVVGSTLDIKD